MLEAARNYLRAGVDCMGCEHCLAVLHFSYSFSR